MDVISGNAAPRAIEKPSISGKEQVGETLTANPGRWAEGPSDFSYQWQLCDKVPSNQVTRSSEVQTNSSGWATIRFQPLKALPMNAGARVNFFVRARKAGENPLAGVSTHRLVSVGIHPTR